MRILLVNYFHPPMVDAQAYRFAQLARHWVEAGHEVEVVTGRVDGEPGQANLHGVSVYRTGWLSRPAMLRSEASGGTTASRRPLCETLRRTYRRWYWPDAWWHWLAGAAWQVWRRSPRADLVISYSPTFAAHLAVLFARRAGRVKRWIADYGDPFSTSSSMPPNHFARYGAINHRAERAVLKSADAAVLTSEGTLAEYRTRFGSIPTVRLIPHLADLGSLYQPTPHATAATEPVVRLTYIGGFHRGIREPYALLDWFQALASMSPVPLALDLYGPDNGFGLAQLGRSATYYHGMVARERALELAAQSDVLVNVDNQDCNMTPSKIVEYIGSGRPVIHLAARAGLHPALQRAVAEGVARVVSPAAGPQSLRDDLEFILRIAGQRVVLPVVQRCLKGHLIEDVAAGYLAYAAAAASP